MTDTVNLAGLLAVADAYDLAESEADGPTRALLHRWRQAALGADGAAALAAHHQHVRDQAAGLLADARAELAGI